MPRGRPKKQKTFSEEINNQESIAPEVKVKLKESSPEKEAKLEAAKKELETISEERRVVKNSGKVWHDLFKLLSATMKKNTSYNPKFPIYEDAEHVHYYHTVDSNGKPMTITNTIGGHFHVIETEKTEPGKPPKILSVSTPKKWASKEVAQGKFKKVIVDAFGPDDQHTHDIEYRYSEEIAVRKINPEAVAVQTYEQQKLSPPAGIY